MKVIYKKDTFFLNVQHILIPIKNWSLLSKHTINYYGKGRPLIEGDEFDLPKGFCYWIMRYTCKPKLATDIECPFYKRDLEICCNKSPEDRREIYLQLKQNDNR